MNDLQLIPVGAGYLYTMDFSADIPNTVTVTGISFTAPGLTLGVAQDELGLFRSSILVSGAVHGTTYTLTGTATLSNGESLPKAATLRGWNGA